jgi:hypothetical protein
MKLRFLCSTHRKWLESDSEAAQARWLSSYSRAQDLFNGQNNFKAVNYAGSALEVAEILIFTHGQNAAQDIQRFANSAVLLCQLLREIEEPRLVCGVIGGSIARLEELRLQGTERTAVLEGCQRLLTVGDQAPTQSPAIPNPEIAIPSTWTIQ